MTDAERFTYRYIQALMAAGYDTIYIAEYADGHPYLFPGIQERPITEASIYNALKRGEQEKAQIDAA